MLRKHPRVMVGEQVPDLKGGDGMTTIRDEADAQSWQEAVKSLLTEEVTSRAEKAAESTTDLMNTVHASIDLFRNNADLVPGTKDFDVELANRLTSIVKPYEVRIDGKLHGYSLPVQPLVDQLRELLKAEREKASAAGSPPAAGGTAAAPAAPAAAGAPSTPAAAVGDQPQAGITSKPGSSGEGKEDFSTLFGTLGLPDLVV